MREIPLEVDIVPLDSACLGSARPRLQADKEVGAVLCRCVVHQRVEFGRLNFGECLHFCVLGLWYLYFRHRVLVKLL